MALLIFFLLVIMMQHSINRNRRERRAHLQEELIRYKEMYDKGIITEEEYEKKKKQALK